MKRNSTFILSLLALALIFSAVISPTLAYFTDHEQADGTAPITLSGKTEIVDDYDPKNLTKTISIQNTEGRDVWIRLLVAVGETYESNVVLTPGEGWSKGTDGYWYYGSPVSAPNTTSTFAVSIAGVPMTNLDISQQQFNVSVLYETTPVQYNEAGRPKAADWNITLDTGTTAP